MPIELTEDGPSGPRIPVLRRQRLGERFVGALVKAPERRDVMKDGAPVLKDNGKPRQELVVTMVTMPGTTMPVGLGEDIHVPAPGEVVRTILRGGGYGQWIEEADKLKPRQVGDVVELTSSYGQEYSASGAPMGSKLTTQAEVDAVPRNHALGIYGELTLRRATPAEAEWVTRAEAEHHAMHQPVTVPDVSEV